MYTKYFGLREDPFSIAANPRFLYMSTQHREALAHLMYGVRSDSGFVLLTGEIGTGKTTLCRCLLEQLPKGIDVAFILNPKVTVNELLGSICDELAIGSLGQNHSVKTSIDIINRYLLARHAHGHRTVVIIDEAQNLSVDVLEQLRLLTNLETNERKLMRIILLGQPELETMLSRPELRQVEQRITARYHLQPLRRSEVGAYVVHRLAVAGGRKPVFSTRVLSKLYGKTRGIPRLINVICDRAMLGAYVQSRSVVTAAILNKAAREVQGRPARPGLLLRGSIAASILLVGAATAAALYYANGGEIATLLPQRLVELAPIVIDDSPVTEVIETPVAEIAQAPAENATGGMDQTSEKPAAQISPWPDRATASDDALSAAHAAQFRQWNIPLASSSADPCTQAVTQGLRCYSGVGNLGSLVSNDRPVILTLLDNRGRQYQATLLTLDDNLATLAFAHGVETVAVQDLEARWQGQYQFLWRTSPQGSRVIRPGKRGADVTWLTKNLLAAGVASIKVHNIYDANVIEAVQAFQRDHGLLADGIAGRKTLIQLNSANDKSIPRLSNRGDS